MFNALDQLWRADAPEVSSRGYPRPLAENDPRRHFNFLVRSLDQAAKSFEEGHLYCYYTTGVVVPMDRAAVLRLLGEAKTDLESHIFCSVRSPRQNPVKH